MFVQDSCPLLVNLFCIEFRFCNKQHFSFFDDLSLTTLLHSLQSAQLCTISRSQKYVFAPFFLSFIKKADMIFTFVQVSVKVVLFIYTNAAYSLLFKKDLPIVTWNSTNTVFKIDSIYSRNIAEHVFISQQLYSLKN